MSKDGSHTHQGSALPLPHIGPGFFFIFPILKPKETSRKKNVGILSECIFMAMQGACAQALLLVVVVVFCYAV